jgi:molybdate/tungstate transport system ATP-binding protein
VIRFDSISLIQGDHHLSGITFEVPEGDYAVLMGPTGCGKTSVLELICGLRTPLSGKIIIDGQDVTKLSPAARGIGYVPQDGALFPGLTVGEQVGFSLRVRKRPEEEIKARVILISDMLGITHLFNRQPAGLSGGERQRVALGRALAFAPKILCLDEPLSALDEDLRADMCALLKKVHAETGVTALHVTHSESEAQELATLHLRLESGSIC